MKFCIKCDNMYYIGISETDGNKMIYYCRNCGHNDEDLTKESVCVLNTQLKKGGGQTFNQIINKYTKMDPTLPRIYNVKCPNVDCATNKADNTKPAEVIYMRYDDDNMKYVYICATCDHIWKTDDSK